MTKSRFNLRKVVAIAICFAGITMFLSTNLNAQDIYRTIPSKTQKPIRVKITEKPGGVLSSERGDGNETLCSYVWG